VPSPILFSEVEMAKIEDPLWVRAKQITKAKSHSTDWAYTLSIYKYMGGTNVGIKVTHDNKLYLLAGIYSTNLTLLYDINEDVLIEVDDLSVRKDKKAFIHTSSKKLLHSEHYKGSAENELVNMELLKNRPLNIYGEVK